MWKAITEKGEKLPDLLVVLAITVVLAAILLPAVTSSHGNEVNAETSAVMDKVVLDGPARPMARTASIQVDSPMEAVVAQESEPDTMTAEVVPALEPGELTALKSMRTTDISYVAP